MKRFASLRTRKPTRALAGSIAALLAVQAAMSAVRAAEVVWDITPGTVGAGDSVITGGTGTWDTTLGNWTTDGGANDSAWVNANNDTALFGDVAGTVTVGTGVTVGGLTFNDNPGYLLTGSSITFGIAGTIAANVDASIESTLDGSASIAKAGSGTLTLSGANTFTGQLSVQDGRLAIGTINNASTSGTLGFSANSVILGTTGGTGTLQYTGGTASSTKRFTMASGGTGAFQVNAAGTTLTLSGVIDGSGTLTKTGPGTLTLTATNTYSGKTVVSAGMLRISTDRGLGAVPGGFQADNVTLNNGASLYKAAGGNTTLAANRGITLGSGVQTLQHNGSGWFRIDAVISGTGGLDVRSDGGNDLRLGGANTYTGDTRLFSNLGMFNASVLQFSTLDYNNYGGQLNYLTSSGFTAVTFGGLKGAQNLAIGTVALSLGNNNNSTSYTGVLSGSGGSVSKIGTGTLTLSGANTYTGATTVANGILRAASITVSGAASNLGNATSAVILGAASTKGTLSYTGGSASFTRGLTVQAGGGEVETVNAATTLTLATGAVSGSGTTLTLSGAGTTTVNTTVNLGALVKSGTGTLNISGGTQTYQTLTTTAGAGVTNVNTAIGSGTTDVVANANLSFGTVSQTLNSLTIGTGATVTFTSGTAGFTDSGGAKGLSFRGPAAVPEPGTLGLLLIGALGLLHRRRGTKSSLDFSPKSKRPVFALD
ncbi:MAG: autotransporter-associated beta strand repeat-containing protein [Chthoniobacter sp.]|nr:autotransporter-associated beta strand repeat-containing protein [Chthoniobacter sp.]